MIVIEAQNKQGNHSLPAYKINSFELKIWPFVFRPTIVNYDGCFVDTTSGAMNAQSGIFTVVDPGIYQLSFTAKYVSSNRGRFGAWSDIYVNHTVRGTLSIINWWNWFLNKSSSDFECQIHQSTIEWFEHYIIIAP